MSVKIERVEGNKFRAVSGGFEIVTGRIDNDHASEGMSPGAVLFAALGLCTGTRVSEQMKLRGWKAGAIRVTVKPKVSKDMNRATEVNMEVELEADLTEEQRAEVLAEAGRCFVGNTIKNSLDVKVHLKIV